MFAAIAACTLATGCDSDSRRQLVRTRWCAHWRKFRPQALPPSPTSPSPARYYCSTPPSHWSAPSSTVRPPTTASSPPTTKCSAAPTTITILSCPDWKPTPITIIAFRGRPLTGPCTAVCTAEVVGLAVVVMDILSRFHLDLHTTHGIRLRDVAVAALVILVIVGLAVRFSHACVSLLLVRLAHDPSPNPSISRI